MAAGEHLAPHVAAADVDLDRWVEAHGDEPFSDSLTVLLNDGVRLTAAGPDDAAALSQSLEAAFASGCTTDAVAAPLTD